MTSKSSWFPYSCFFNWFSNSFWSTLRSVGVNQNECSVFNRYFALIVTNWEPILLNGMEKSFIITCRKPDQNTAWEPD